MRAEEGFNPKESKAQALDRADAEEQEGSAHPLSPAFTPEQKRALRWLDEELETIYADVQGDVQKACGYAGELEQILAELEMLPYRDRFAALVDPLEEALSEAWSAALSGNDAVTVEKLHSAIAHANAYMAALHA